MPQVSRDEKTYGVATFSALLKKDDNVLEVRKGQYDQGYRVRETAGKWRRERRRRPRERDEDVAFAAEKRGFAVEYAKDQSRVTFKGHGGELALRLSEATEQKFRPVKTSRSGTGCRPGGCGSWSSAATARCG